jgi:hypothetical protein
MTISVLVAMEVPLVKAAASKPLGNVSFLVIFHPSGTGNWFMSGRVEI